MIEGLSFFGKTAKPRGFNFKPRYFDETKDEIETRLNKRRAIREVPPVHSGGSGRNTIKFNSNAPKEVNSGSTLRLVLILGVLIGVGYWLLNLTF